ncbi:MAG: type II toxin-antitoxin system RelE/ParE family toxin [Acidobacteria bacterium]|nr:type II toxin-antitoxin system RelE/ParE family toxin [Acidobacteriota bacterium]
MKKVPFSFHRFAEQELEQAAGHYFEIDPDLEKDFLDSVDHAIGQVRELPFSCPEIFEGIRRKVLSRFHHYNFCKYENGQIRILSVRHQSQDSPDKIDRS